MNSDFIDGLYLHRRDALKALVGLPAMGLSANVHAAGEVPRSGSRSGALDYSNPYDNLYAFGKIWAGYDEPQYGAYHGLMYARVGNNRHQALFGYTGSGVMQAKIDDDGNLAIRGKETGFFTDLATGDILEEWQNPYTGELVKPLNFLNRVGGVLTKEMPRFAFGGVTDEPTLMNAGTHQERDGTVPFILPFETYGDDFSWGGITRTVTTTP